MKKIALFLLIVVSQNLVLAQEKIRKDEQYIQTYAPLAVEEMGVYKIPASITLAQGILETGNGQSNLARYANNHFGIKCKEEWRGEKTYHDDDLRGECFRKYSSASDSYRDHSLFLANRPYYKNLFLLNPTDYKAWAHGLKKAGYATNAKYAYMLISLIERYGLDKFDELSKEDVYTELAKMYPGYSVPSLNNKNKTQTILASMEVEKIREPKIENEAQTILATTKVEETKTADQTNKAQTIPASREVEKISEPKLENEAQTTLATIKVEDIKTADQINEVNDTSISAKIEEAINPEPDVYIVYQEKKEKVKEGKLVKKILNAKINSFEFPSLRIKFHPNKNIKFVVIKEGDRLEDISKAYNISIRNLKLYNDLTFQEELVINQKIFIEPKRKVGLAKEYITKEGDKMYDIAQNNGISLLELYKRNLMRPGQEPKMGDKILLKGKKV